MVEFHRRDDGVKIHGHRGFYELYPIEYKKGKPKLEEEDILQLVAQVMCLEEMFSTEILEGALFYGETRRRQVVGITKELRQQVQEMTVEMHHYYSRRYTPKVKYSKKCNSCSLREICMPRLGTSVSVKGYINHALEDEE